MARISLWGAILLVLMHFAASEKPQNNTLTTKIKAVKRDLQAVGYTTYFGKSSAANPFASYITPKTSYIKRNPASNYIVSLGSTPSIPTLSGYYTTSYQPHSYKPSHSHPPAPSPAETIKCGDSFPIQCQQSRYRTFDGSCNNQYRPTWGMANTRYGRLLPAEYADGIHAPRAARSGNTLPASRTLSYVLSPDYEILDPKWTLAAMQWGQIITHDMAMIDGSTQSTAHPTKCCSPAGQLIVEALDSPLCYPIIVPDNDPVYASSGMKCMNFVRSNTDLDRGCSSSYEPAEQLTVVTSFLDLSLVYGASDQVAAGMRAGVGGRLTVDVRGNREWLPPSLNRTRDCDQSAQVCYRSGDTRVNQNPQLTVLQLILHREHNRISGVLAQINPHWSDETIFQEARRILMAINQHISYVEWLPIFIGLENAYRYKILYNTKDYVNDYDYSVNPSVLNEFSTAAFRSFHSLIAGNLDLVNEPRFTYAYNPFRSLRLSDHFNNPTVLEQNNNFADLTRGLGTQPEEAADQFFDKEVTNYLFRGMNALGGDLRATDIQRSRDHALASYNKFRGYCGLPTATAWNDFLDYISPENVQRLSQMYESVDDVDLTVGGILEQHVPGSLAGPTFLCILTEQFFRTRVGDRFWYESGDPEIAFTLEQLNEIRKVTVSRLFCDNGDNVQTMQPRGFEQISETNPLMSCELIPAIDLSLWKDYSPSYIQQRPF
ncbi:peroxidase [Belonocnema kinseyi]|uniref:peroxidase n=1 Tax=Belonocnema kinseyi TaxID=2817044 RepID=UPI00143D7BCE|nr:peroxidase [Belonocnema kinseyi]